MRKTMSIRLANSEQQRLRDVAEVLGETPTGLAARLVEEGMRMAEHPRIVFRPAPRGGRVAGLMAGPDVAEVMAVIQELDAVGQDALSEAATWFGLHPNQVHAAVRYTAAFPDEINDEVAWRAKMAADTKARYDQEQTLLK